MKHQAPEQYWVTPHYISNRRRRIAMALMERIHSNYRFVIGFNGTLIGLGLAGILPPAASAALHNLSTLGVSLRSMSALPEPKQDNDRCI